MKTALKLRLLAYLQKHSNEWIAKGHLADLARDSDLHATGESCGRRLRELENENKVEVKYVRQHSFYRIKAKTLF